jgi:hypothetical protein
MASTKARGSFPFRLAEAHAALQERPALFRAQLGAVLLKFNAVHKSHP